MFVDFWSTSWKTRGRATKDFWLLYVVVCVLWPELYLFNMVHINLFQRAVSQLCHLHSLLFCFSEAILSNITRWQHFSISSSSYLLWYFPAPKFLPLRLLSVRWWLLGALITNITWRDKNIREHSQRATSLPSNREACRFLRHELGSIKSVMNRGFVCTPPRL